MRAELVEYVPVDRHALKIITMHLKKERKGGVYGNCWN